MYIVVEKKGRKTVTTFTIQFTAPTGRERIDSKTRGHRKSGCEIYRKINYEVIIHHEEKYRATFETIGYEAPRFISNFCIF